MTGVGVVTDSTASLPPEELAQALGVLVVPLHVVLGRRTGAEGLEVSTAEVAQALAERRVQVSTSRPTPAELAEAYRLTGATEVVSVHLSSRLSGTGDSAVLAAREVAAEGIAVRVVDSRSIGMGLGFGVLAAARAAAAGADLDEVERVAVGTTRASACLLYVDTLEHLRRGGRIGAAAALLGTALAVKPLLHVVDGAIEPLEKVRTASRALVRLVELAVEVAGGRLVDVAVHHVGAAARAAELATQLSQQLDAAGPPQVSEVGAVVGAHVGPGAIAVVVSPRQG